MGRGRNRHTPKTPTRVEYCKSTENEYKIEKITIHKIWETVKQVKRRKTPGPDKRPMNLFKEMDEKCFEAVAFLLNTWWNEEDLPTETLQA